MKPTRMYANSLKRLKRARGFGIHSPFAFSFVTTTLSLRLPYYAYAAIGDLRREALRLARACGGRHPRIMSEKNARLLFRVVVRFNPMCIAQFGAGYGVSTAATLLVDSRSSLVLHAPAMQHAAIFSAITGSFASRIRFADTLAAALAGEPQMALVTDLAGIGADDLAALLTGFVAAGGRRLLVVRNLARHSSGCLPLWNRLTAAMQHGMSFTNGSIGFIVADEKLPLQHFTLWF